VNVRTLKLLNEDGNVLRKLWKKSEVLKVPAGSNGIVGTRSKKVNEKNIADKEARIERRLRKEGIRALDHVMEHGRKEDIRHAFH
jgi:hypothetical protein